MTEVTFQVKNVRFEHYQPQYAIGCSETRPRLSWQLSGTLPEKGTLTAYEVELHHESSGDSDICQQVENGKRSEKSTVGITVRTAESILNPWPFDFDLGSRQRVVIRIRASVGSIWSEWSGPSSYEVGLLRRSDWACERIIATSYNRTESSPQPEQLIRKDFDIRQDVPIRYARLYAVVQGVYEAEINGKPVSKDFLAPGWTEYHRHIRYQTYDVTDILDQSSMHQCIAFRVAEGWFCGRLGFFGGKRNRWGDFPALMAQMEVTYQDGSKEVIATDGSWMSCLGPIRLAELYDGEKYDARLEIANWSTPEIVRSQAQREIWQASTRLEPMSTDVKLVSGWGEPVRRVQTLQPTAAIITPSGKNVIDFGQNLVGYVRIKKFIGQKAQKISLLHAEVLENEELGRRPLRMCDALDEYTCKGNPDGEAWEPRFTFHGFRYCQVDGWPSQIGSIESYFEAVVCHTDMENAGLFDCSEPMINQLHQNAFWSTKGNFLSIPTDCPQRDERLGWTGDIALFAPTATRLFDCFGMLSDWMLDVDYDQQERGGIPALVTPNIFDESLGIWGKALPIAIWHDVVILVPWALYQESGDKEILMRHYGNMRYWLERIPRDEDRVLWDPTTFQLGDWLDPSASPHAPMDGQTDPMLVANAFLVRSLELIAQIGNIVGDIAGAERYAKEASIGQTRFADQYITKSGRVVSDSQTANSLAICFDLFPSVEQKRSAGKRLATIVRRNNFKIATGFAGTPIVLDALSDTGNVQIAYSMLQARECPSWLYPITLGATTIWERWDSMMPDGTVNPGEMTSFNHYSFGAVAHFLHSKLAGLQCVEPGWRRTRAAPLPGGGFTHARSEHRSPYGLVACSWILKDGVISITVVVPPLTTMEVVIPLISRDTEICQVGPGTWDFERSYANDVNWPVRPIESFPLT